MNEYTTIEQYEIAHLEYLLILHVKSLRDKKGWSQKELSQRMGVTSSFVGNVENLNQRHKYSIRHVALLTKAFGFKSQSQLFKFAVPEYDEIILKVQNTNIDYITTKGGKEEKKTRVIKSELLEIIPIKFFKENQ